MKRAVLTALFAAAVLLAPAGVLAQDAGTKPTILVAPFSGSSLPSEVFGYDVAGRLESLLMVGDAYAVITLERLHSMLPAAIAQQYPDRRQAGDPSSTCIRSRQVTSIAAVALTLCANVRTMDDGAFEVSATLYNTSGPLRALAPVTGRGADAVAAELLVRLLRP